MQLGRERAKSLMRSWVDSIPRSHEGSVSTTVRNRSWWVSSGNL